MIVERKVDGVMKWCVVHSHPQKPGSSRDKPPGTIIKCFPHTAEGRERALAMHRAILASQEARKNEPSVVLRTSSLIGSMLVDGDASHYVYPQKYKRHLNEPVFVGGDDRILGVATLAEPEAIKSSDLESAVDKHGLDANEVRKKWNNVKKFWLYPVTILEKYDRPMEYVASDCEKSWIEDPVIRKKADGDQETESVEKFDAIGFDFVEGSSGVGVIQTHEIGSIEQFELSDEAHGWVPVELDLSQLDHIASLAGLETLDVIEKYMRARDGDGFAFDDVVISAAKKNLDEFGRDLLTIAKPIEIHSDFRMVEDGDSYWQGGEITTPGNQFATNIIKEFGSSEIGIEINKIDPDSNEFVRGPIEWMEVGVSKAQIFPPGAPGSTENLSSRFRVREQFNWKAGVQEPDFKEFKFVGEALDGRFVMKRIQNNWILIRPADQDYVSEVLKNNDEFNEWDAQIIKRSSDEKRTVVAVVLKPGITDAQGDIIKKPQVIEDAAENYLANLIAGKARIGYLHEDFTKKLIIIQSYIAPQPLIINGKNIPAGAWIVKMRVLDDEAWINIKTGKIRGFSIGGRARVRRIAA